MAKRQKGKKDKKKKIGPQQPKTVASILGSIGKGIWQIIGAISVIVGVIAASYAFAPSVSVSPSSLLDAEYPFSNLFKVSYMSWLQETSVEYQCRLHLIELSGDIKIKGVHPTVGILIHDRTDNVAQISRNETHDVECAIKYIGRLYSRDHAGTLKPSRILKTDITIIVSFEYPLRPWRIQKNFCFETYPVQENKLDWKSKPCFIRPK